MWTYVFSDFNCIENIFALQSGNKVLFCDIGFIKFVACKMVFSHIAVIFRFLEFIKSLDDVGNNFYFFLFWQFWIEVVSSKRLLQQGKHN